jgi:hypothetical protein
VDTEADEDEVNGGDVSGKDAVQAGAPVQSVTGKDVGVTTTPPKDPEPARQLLAYFLVGLLALTIVGHYIVLLILQWNGKSAEPLANAFNTSLPVISGLVSAAVTYYFTREQKK